MIPERILGGTFARVHGGMSGEIPGGSPEEKSGRNCCEIFIGPSAKIHGGNLDEICEVIPGGFPSRILQKM